MQQVMTQNTAANNLKQSISASKEKKSVFIILSIRYHAYLHIFKNAQIQTAYTL